MKTVYLRGNALGQKICQKIVRRRSIEFLRE
jgi:hypothetical protein